MQTISPFNVTGWEYAAYDQPEGAPVLARVTVRKAFRGDLTGESVGELLMCHQADPSDLAGGAGYVVSERVTGTLGGRQGSFVMQHGGLSGPGIAPFTYGHIVPGSGTDELRGLTGTLEIAAGPEGHTLTLDYNIAAPSASEA